jgi:hypothetical protein
MPLSSIIAALNERFGADFTLIDQLVFDQIDEELVANAELARQAQDNCHAIIVLVWRYRGMARRQDRHAALADPP